MTAMSRNKGARGEREFARLMDDMGIACERTGRNGRTSEDVTHAIPGVHIEVKRTEKYAITAWLDQAEKDADDSEAVWVAFRQSGQPWRVIVDATWLIALVKRDMERSAQ